MADTKKWAELAAKELRGRAIDDLTWDTLEGIKVQPLYTQDDAADLPHMGGTPGVAPYTRGVRATMYAGRPWTIRQYAGFSTAEESQRILPQGAGRRAARRFGCFRSWPRTVAMTATTRGRGRCRQGRRGDRQCRGYENPV